MNQGWLPSVPGLGQVSKRPKTCCCLPAVHKAQSLEEPQSVSELGEAGSQGFIRVELAEFTRLMQVQMW